MTNFENITTREAYIAWRSEWRAQYKALSREIRGTKYKISNTFRSGDYAGRLQNELRALQAKANSMLEDRKEAKLHAAEQRAAQREMEAA